MVASETLRRLFLPLLVPVLLLAFLPLVAAQDDGATSRPAKEHKQYLDAKETKFYHQTDPLFAFKLAKKLRDRWQFVDLDAKREALDARLAEIERKSDADSSKSEDAKKATRTSVLKDRAVVNNWFDSRVRMRLEVEGSRNEAMIVTIAPASAGGDLDSVKPMEWVKKNFKIHQTINEKDTTSKSMAKRSRFTHTYEVIATPNWENSPWYPTEKVYLHYRTFLVFNKDRTSRSVVQMMYWVPASKFDKETAKDTQKEVNMMVKALKVL